MRKVFIAGASGMIGRHVTELLQQQGVEVVEASVPRPARRKAHNPQRWHRALELWTPELFSGYDCVMFFGGEAINSRWTHEKLQRIRNSRHLPCRRIAYCASAAENPPRVIISASATGFYGDRGEELLTEESPAGTVGILPSTSSNWESCWQEAENAGIRVVKLRIGVVLSPQGGALKMMLPAFRFGLGGPMGGGKQWMSWISAPDLARLTVWAMDNDAVNGPLNAVAPEPVRQADFARDLGRVLKRPAIIPVPAFALKTAFGKMADETVLSSFRVVPKKAQDLGFEFHHPDVRTALTAVLK